MRACGRNSAPSGEAGALAALGTGVLDVAEGVRGRGRVRLGGHDPRDGREGRVDELASALLAHVWGVSGGEGMEGSRVEWIGWKGGLGKREWEENEGGKRVRLRACVRCVLNGHREKVAWLIASMKKKSTQ